MDKKVKHKIEVIKNDSIVKLEISGAYHKRLVALYLDYSKMLGEEKIKRYSQIISDKNLSNVTEEEKNKAFQYETLIMIIKSLEDQFRKERLISFEEIETIES